MSILLVLLMYAVWSSVFSIGKMTLQYCPPLFFTGARMGLAGCHTPPFLPIFKRASFKLTLEAVSSLSSPLGFFSIYLCNALEFWGFNISPPQRPALSIAYPPSSQPSFPISISKRR